MLKTVVVAELIFVIVLSAVTITLKAAIFRKKSITSTWNQCPALCLLLISNALLAVLGALFATQWLLFALGLIENIPENSLFLTVVGRLFMILQLFNHCSAVGLFAQRVYCLLYPAKIVTNFNYIILGILLIIFLCGSIMPIYSTITFTTPTGYPVPEGCFSFSCMKGYSSSVRLSLSAFSAAISTIVTVLGSYMVYLLYKRRKTRRSVLEKNKNNFASYVFVVRFIDQTIPFFADTILSASMNVYLGNYLGPYGVIGAATDYTIQTIVYYMIIRNHKRLTTVSTAT
ncbi:hypothetical protein QR680_010088 [Steinernema hermaphroditum]|uniref:Uncharacterized protein n=1 Tax=Steinernema hermaphroditum TaxID=289476 RepID=A0AA39IMN8_9BILA|nr:hypothetical protein QR680_010088 [Steinernema hermaphroditum]